MKAVFIALGALLVLAAVILSNMSLTGFITSPTPIRAASVAFSQENLSYNQSLVSIENGTIKLKPTITRTDTEKSEFTQYIIIKALYEDSSDKTEKILDVDDKKIEVGENRLVKIIFNGDLSNGDTFSVYIKSGKSSAINLCSFESDCDKQYGSFDYTKNNEGLYNITIQGLDYPTRFFTAKSSEQIDIDQIKSDKQAISRIIVDPEDKTAKIIQRDGEKQSIGKEKVFYLITNSPVKDGSTATLYMEGDSDSTVKLCSLPSCSEVYGTINYKKDAAGFYNSTLSIQSPANKFFVDTEKTIKIDLVNITHLKTTVETSYNTTYPKSASIETPEFSVKNLKRWVAFSFDKTLNGNNLEAFYSLDNSSWLSFDSSGSLENINSSQKNIKFKIGLMSDGYSTPEIGNLRLFYVEALPYFEDQQIVQNSAISGSVADITFNATNPELINSVTASIQNYNGIILKNISLVYDDSKGLFVGQWNTSGQKEGVYFINLEVTSNYTETRRLKDVIALLSDIKGSFSSVPSKSGDVFRMDAREQAGTEIEIKSGQINSTINIIQYSKNIKQSLPSERDAGKYVEIISKESISNFSSAKIKIYYTDQEISSAGIEESTLLMHFYNETSKLWDKIKSSVNTTGKYVEAEVTHFSTYGLFGDAKSSPTQAQSSGGGGSGTVYDIQKPSVNPSPAVASSKQSPTKVQENKQSETKPVEELNQTCNSKIDVIFDNQAGPVNKEMAGKVINSGTCYMDKIEITVTGGVEGFLYAYPDIVNNLPPGKDGLFSIKNVKDSSIILVTDINGLTIASKKDDSRGHFLSGGIKVDGFASNGASYTKELEISINVEKETPRENIIILALSLLAAFGILFIARRV